MCYTELQYGSCAAIFIVRARKMEKQKVTEMLTLFQKRYPNPRPALRSTHAFELLVAVVLSAQCTDERVNRVTESLFIEYGTPEKMLALGEEDLGKRIFSCEQKR